MRVGSVRCCLLLLLEDEIPLRVGKSLLDPEEEEEVATLGDCQLDRCVWSRNSRRSQSKILNGFDFPYPKSIPSHHASSPVIVKSTISPFVNAGRLPIDALGRATYRPHCQSQQGFVIFIAYGRFFFFKPFLYPQSCLAPPPSSGVPSCLEIRKGRFVPFSSPYNLVIHLRRTYSSLT